MKVLYKSVKHHINNKYYNIGNIIMKANHKMALGENVDSEKIKAT